MTIQDAIPSAIGPYPVVRVVAAGGMAIVYEVTDPDTGRPLAVKVLQSKGAGAPRFAREYRALTRVDHPNVVRVFRYALADNGLPYLVMEMLHGQAAQVRVKALGRPGDAIRTAEAIRVAMHVAEALACLHARGIIHRDLKSSNVIVLADGHVKLLDFGTARIESIREQLTEPGEFVGTFHYASPEQLTGGRVDHRADLYALGVLLYRMLSGRRPFEGDDPTALARQHLEHQPIALERLVRSIPAPVVELVNQLLAKSASGRPADANIVVEFLRPFVVGPPPGNDDNLPELRFVGRQSHLRAIRRLLEEPESGAGLVFCGPEGSGRGRLVGQAVHEAAKLGYRAIRLLASGTVSPFAPVCLALASGLLADGDATAAACARGALADAGVEPHTFAQALGARARLDQRPLLLAIEGMEEAAEHDVNALVETMRAVSELGGNVVLVGAWGEDAMASTWPGLRLMQVPPLTGLEVAVLASRWFGTSVEPPELVRRLQRASGGMPAPLEDLLRLLPRDPRVRPPAALLPESARESLALRVESLPTASRRVLEVLALAEGDLPIEALASALDQAAGLTREAIAGLVRDRILEPHGQSWRFQQGIAAEFVRECCRPTRRALYCRRLAQALAPIPPSAAVAAILLEADHIDAAVDAIVRWARPLMAAGLHAEALPGVEAIVLRGGHGPDRFALWRAYAECLAVVRSSSLQTDQALAMAQSLAESPTEAGEVAWVGAAVAHARGDAVAERASLVRAVESLRRAAGGAELLVDTLARLSDRLTCVGEFDAAWRIAREATELDPNQGRALVALGSVKLQRGEVSQAEQHFQNALQQNGDAWRALVGMGHTLRLQGRLSEGRRLLEDGLVRARVSASAPGLAVLLLGAAQIDIDLYRHGLARDRVHQALDALGDNVPPRIEPQLGLLRARLLDLAGDPEGALRLLRPVIESTLARGWRYLAAELQGLEALLIGRLGRDSDAALLLGTSTRTLSRMGAYTALSELYVTLIDRRLPTTGTLHGEIEGWVDRQPARLARLALLTDASRQEPIEGGLSPDVWRNRAQNLLRQLTQLQFAEDRPGFLLHPRRQNLRSVKGEAG